MAVLAFWKAQTAYYVISTFPSIILLLFFTEETLKIFNMSITIFQNYNNFLIIILYLIFAFISTFFINKKFIKRKYYSFILTLMQLAVQSIFIFATIIIFFFLVIGGIHISQFIWYLLFCLMISFSIFDVTCINQYITKQPEHLKTIEDLLIKTPRNNNEKIPQFMRPEGLLWCDFEAGLGINRTEILEVIDTIRTKKYCTLIGHPASGKSVILRRIGFNLTKQNFIVFYVNAEWLDPEKSYLEIRKWNLPNTVLLIDDLHRNPSSCARLIQQIINLKIKIVLSTRDFDFNAVRIDYRGILSKIMDRKIETNVDRIIIISLIKKYCIWKKIKVKISKVDVDSMINICGNDLWIASYILLTWNPRINKIRDISKNAIYEQIYLNRIKKWLSLENKIIDTLIIISTLYQYEIPCSESFLNKNNLGSSAFKLAKIGDIMIRGRYYVLHHSSVAKIYLETFERYGYIEDFYSHTTDLLLKYADESEEDRELMFYKISLDREPDSREEKILREISLKINSDDIVSQIEGETDISKIIEFIIKVLNIDKNLAINIIRKISLDFLERRLNKIILISRKKEILEEFKKVDEDVSVKLSKKWKKRIAVVPVYNEQQHIKKILDVLINYTDSIIVVDDGSSDMTGNVAKKYGALVLRHEKHKGITEAIITGLNKAKELGASYVILFKDGHAEKFMLLDEFIRPVLKDDFDLIVGTYQGLLYRLISGSSSFITMSSSSVMYMYSSDDVTMNFDLNNTTIYSRVLTRKSRVRRFVNIHIMNKKAIKCYLKYLRREEFSTYGINVSRILFKKILRVSEVKKIYPFYTPTTSQEFLHRAHEEG